MWWALAAKAALGAGQSLMQSTAARQQAKAVQAENERQNKLSWQEMARRTNSVNVQRGLLRQQTGTDLMNIQNEANRAAGEQTAQAAAAGIEGTSVNEVATDINRQNQQTQTKARDNLLIQEVNLDTSLEDTVNAAVAAQRYSQEAPSVARSFGQAVGSGLVGAASAYATQRFNYGATSGTDNSPKSGSTGGGFLGIFGG